MGDQGGSENPILKLYMRQLSQNLDVPFSTLGHLGVLGRAWTILTPDLQLRVLEEEELYIDPVPKGNTDSMARTPYVTVRGAEPMPAPPPQPQEVKMAYEEDEKEEKAQPIKLDSDEINSLLDVVLKTKDLPNLSVLGQAAQMNLAIMAKEVQDELEKRAEEAQKKDAEKAAKEKKDAA